jgi:biotin carboxylase
MRSLLMLGGSDIQMHAIARARELGLRVITCDNRPDNPGHRLAHEYHEVSTTDLDGVLGLARRLCVDGILAYASDPAALTAAYVAEQLGLPGDPYHAVRLAQDKLLLRGAQQAAGLPTPLFVDAADRAALNELLAHSPFGVVVKPTDASGSKGVTLLEQDASADNLVRAVASALEVSRCGRVVAERVWGVGTPQFGGDVLVWRGEVAAASFGDQVMSPVTESRIPIGVLCPTSAADVVVNEAREQVNSLVSALGLWQGVYNVEFRVNESGQLTIIDFGARIGGNLLGVVHQLATGVDFVAATIRMALGDPPQPVERRDSEMHAGHLVLHSLTEGVFQSIDISESLRSIAHAIMVAARPGDRVRPYRTSADRLGVIVMASNDRGLLETVYRCPELHISVRMRESLF